MMCLCKNVYIMKMTGWFVIMKLNADIIRTELSALYNIACSGPKTARLSLARPEFYMEDSSVFLAGHLYLATIEHLPKRPSIQKGAALVCIGDNVSLKYYRERLSLIVIRNKADFFKVFHTLQQIYDRYDEWEKTLYQDLLDDIDINRIIADSADILKRPVFVLDKSFKYIASASASGTPNVRGFLNSQSLNEFMNDSDMMTERKGAILLELAGGRFLCVNLFNKEDAYEGCLCIEEGGLPFSSGDEGLAEFLAGILETALEHSPEMINDEQSSMKGLLQSLMMELPISPAQRLILNAANRRDSYAALDLHFSDQSSQIPGGYVCDIFEETFPASYAFVYDTGIAGFINVSLLQDEKTGDYRPELVKRLTDLTGRLYLKAGISNDFDDLFDIRIHFSQAQSALENGSLLDPGKTVCWFHDYALTEMIINSLGGLPVEAYFPQGLREIRRHDESSGVSYMETLRVFLQENMSYTTAARKLYIHRSTLIDRIARIEKELHIDLSDPDQRLLLENLMKAIELEKKIRQN